MVSAGNGKKTSPNILCEHHDGPVLACYQDISVVYLLGECFHEGFFFLPSKAQQNGMKKPKINFQSNCYFRQSTCSEILNQC